jgi:subfamily B ATP-binding cassette protein MsbA
MVNRLGHRIVAEVQKRMFDRVVDADLAVMHSHLSGGLVGRLVGDTNQLRSVFTSTLSSTGRDLVTAAALILFMFWSDWVLSLLGVLIFACSAVPLQRLSRRMAANARSLQMEATRYAGHLGQVFQGIRHVKAYRMEAVESAQTVGFIERINAGHERQALIRSLSAPVLEIIGSLALVLFLLVGGHRVETGQLSPGTLATLASCLLAVSFLLRNMGTAQVAAQNALVAISRIYEIIDLPRHIMDAPGAAPLQVGHGNIRFKNVSFGYAGAHPALRRIDLEIPGRSVVALVGASGAGKSTLLNLLLRFYDPDQGSIEIDGTDIAAITQASLRDAIALVSQEGSVFDDTVRANIAYGRPDADETAICAAARAAEAEEFILAMPDGYDTRIGERGVRLSGGQQQRLALARAILKQAPILLLDEATASLDTLTEQAVQQTLRRHMAGCTSIIIAHRLSTIVDADMIHVMDAGQIVQSGRHQDLLLESGPYVRLWRGQQGDAEAGSGNERRPG